MKPCIVCKGKNFETVHNIEQFTIQKCLTCELVRTKEKPNEKYHEYHRDEKEYMNDELLFRNIFTKRFKIINKLMNSSFLHAREGIKKKKSDSDSRQKSLKKKRILDIGASTGTMLSIFKDAGWDVWGVEPSDTAAKVAQKRGIKMSHGFFEKVKLPDNHFDVVIMNHTFEHVEDPLKVLRKIKKVLKKTGIVYIDVPNFGSWNAQIKGLDWGYLMPSEHTFHYTPLSLQMLMKRAGFTIVWWGSWSGIFDVGDPVQKLWYQLSHFRLSFLKDLVKIPLNIFSTFTKRGTSLAVVGEKG